MKMLIKKSKKAIKHEAIKPASTSSAAADNKKQRTKNNKHLHRAQPK
jgi:hypothetical protein